MTANDIDHDTEGDNDSDPYRHNCVTVKKTDTMSLFTLRMTRK